MAVLSMSKQEFSRLDVLFCGFSRVRLRVSDACVLIGLQRRQVFRLLRGLKQDGAASCFPSAAANPATTGYPLRFALSRCRLCGSVLRLWPELGGGEAGRASRLIGFARDLARLDDRRRAVAGPLASSPLAASAAPRRRRAAAGPAARS